MERTDPRAPTVVHTLLGNGYQIESVQTRGNYTTFVCSRVNEFEVEERYVFALLEVVLEQATGEAIAKYAASNSAEPVFIGDDLPEEVAGLTWNSFQARLGGSIKALLPLEESFPEDLVTLGHNKAVQGVAGQPDDLFEEYVQVALQFLLQDRVIRFGKKRSGQALPDGLGLRPFVLPYDAKAYGDGYEVDKESIRQFSSYVNEFHEKYEMYLGRAHAFLVVSGHFKNDQKSLENRSAEMQASCGVRLAYICASDLGEMTALFCSDPRLRNAVDWKRIFSDTFVTAEAVKKAVESAVKDGIVQR